MDTNRFDDFARVLSAARSRRAALGGLLAGGLGALLSRMGMHEAAAKKKKKKKKCKSTQQKCGKQCIPLTDCCGGCGGDQTCSNGRCGCPGDTIACGQECVTGSQCCNAADCGSGQSCVDGFCRCPDASDIPCGSSGCCDGASQVCANNTTTGASSCQAGSCPADSDFCADTVTFTCGPQCACVTSINNRTVCSNLFGDCEECLTDAQCSTRLGQDAVCVPSGSRCSCAPGINNTCRIVGCPST